MAYNKIKTYIPIIGMGLLFIIGISLALVFSPIFIQMNAKADFSEFGDLDENSIVIILIYLGAILVFTGIILIIGRAKKGKLLKYIIIGVVGITIVYTLWPLIGYAVHGPLLLLWDENDEISQETTFLISSDIDSDTDPEIILGTNSGEVIIYDAKTNDLEWKSNRLGSTVMDIEIVDMESDNQNELLILTDEQLNIFQVQSSGNLDLVCSDDSGEISSFTSGDSDADDIMEIFLGTRLGELKVLDWELLDDNENDSLPLQILNTEINQSVTALQIIDSTEFDNPILMLGTQNSIELYHPENGTKATDIRYQQLANLRNPVRIDIITINQETTEFSNGYDLIVLVLTKNKILTSLAYSDFTFINQESGIRDYGEPFTLDLLDKYDGEELILNGNDQLYMMYSKDSLWDEYIEPSGLISEFDSDGIGTSALNIDDDDEIEVIVGTGSGYTYGEFKIAETSDIPCFTAIAIAVGLIILLLMYPEWYVIDITGIMIGAGVCTIIGISIAILPILVFLIALAVYDAISVYKTKHMIDLADNVMDMKLPIILVIPKKLKYSFIHQKRLKEQLDKKEEREAMFMGLGDVIIPGTLAVSAFTFLPKTDFIGPFSSGLIVALGVLIGSMVGFGFLMHYVLKGRPQAGLPLLNTGAILGYLITYILVFQNLSFGLKGIF